MPLGGAPTCPCCDQRVYFSDEKTFMSQSWHKKCFKCGECSKQLETGNANHVNNGLICATCLRQKNKQPSQPKEAYVNHEDPECCPRCGTRVYFAEQMLGMGRKYHIKCFTCAACSKKVELAHASDHDGELYCRSCHGRQFGPKGYGFAGGSGTGLSMDTGKIGDMPTGHIPHTAQAYIAPAANKENNGGGGGGGLAGGAGGDFCPRCGLQVFIAERKQGAGNVYHMSCFTCELCKKKLDASTLTEKQEQIFCKTCYGRHFGPKGYGFGGGAGILQMN